MAEIVGRDAEIVSLQGFLAGIFDGASALVLEGEAGMGKTTLWSAGAAAALERGLLVLQARPSESETALSFAALGDLLDHVLERALSPLPEGQRRALSLALVLEEAGGSAPDPHAVGVAVLNALRAIAGDSPVVVCIDDVQWLDAASSAALVYAARRLRDEPVGLLLARRVQVESLLVSEVRRSLPLGRFHEVDVGPLELGALHRVVDDHLGVALPRPLLAEVHQASGGNPFYALEIVRSLRREEISVEAGQPLPVPESLHGLVHGRLLALPLESREYLLAAAAHAHPTTTVVEAATGVSRQAGLVPALEAGVVELDGNRIRFTHPLLAAGAYDIADPLRRQEIHIRLSSLLEDPEARAWQLAASQDAPDESVAAVLEDAAGHARARGAPRPAALLLDRASELTPSALPEESVRRAVEAAYLHYESGDSPRAEGQLRAAIAELDPGRPRARALMRLARVRAYEALPEAVELFLQAVDEAGGDREILVVAHEGVATCLWRLYERLDEAAEHAELAATIALDLGNDALAGEAVGTYFVTEWLVGRETAMATAARALALQSAAEELRVLAQPRFAVFASAGDGLERARVELVELLRRATELGDESSPPLVLAQLGLLECHLGEHESAFARAREGQNASEQSGQRANFALTLALESLVEARRGRSGPARVVGLRALELVPETGARQAELVGTWALGHLELALGAPEAAVARLAPLVSFVRGESIAEPSALPFVVDQVEALVELGRPDEAVELLDWYEGNARRLERASALANCLRCRGLLAASEGMLDEAVSTFEEAMAWHANVELPLDRGRTLLALGAAKRRLKRRREARETLEQSLAVFERIGAMLWVERARAELKRISGRAATPGALTPAETRVAALVAEGKTNREVAAALFLSERTVEGHLSRIFGKLGIRHRSEVARSLAARQTQGVATPNPGDTPVSTGPAAP